MLLSYKKSAITITVAALISPYNALSEQSSNNAITLEEVVVTAQKREQNLQDVPVAISVINTQQINDRKIDDISDIGNSAPNVQIAPSPGGTTGVTASIRGAASINPSPTWEPSVGIYMDGVFIAKNVGGLFDVAELSGIEILRGPQGTLYGKNTTGGAINLVTRKPAEEAAGKIKLGAGNYGYTELATTVDTGKLGDVASFLFSYSKRNRDGFYKNVHPNRKIDEFNKLDSGSGLIKANFDITDQLQIDYAYDFSKKNNTVALGQPEYLVNGKLPKPKRLGKGSIEGAGYDRSKSSGQSIHLTWDINDNLIFKSISAYREMEFNDQNEYDGSPTPIPKFVTERHVKHHQTSQEFQFIGTSDYLNYVFGLFYFGDDVDVVNPYTKNLGGGSTLIRNFYGAKSTSYAAFGQADWLATDSLTITLGGRWTQEKKDSYINHPDPVTIPGVVPEIVPPFSSYNNTKTWSNFSPMFVASYAFTDDLTTYAKVSQGWRSGGFNGEAETAESAQVPYKAETTLAFEVGMKAKWFDGQTQTNVAIFQNHTDNMQLSYYLASGYSVIENAGKSVVRGIELEALHAITEELTAFANFSYMDAKYKDYKVNGVQMKDEALFAYTPKRKFAIGMSYHTDVGFAQLRINGDYSFTGNQVFYRQKEAAKATASPSYGIFNGRIALTDIPAGNGQSLAISLWGKNLTGEAYRLNGIPGLNAYFPNAAAGINYYGDPRTFGLDVTYNF